MTSQQKIIATECRPQCLLETVKEARAPRRSAGREDILNQCLMKHTRILYSPVINRLSGIFRALRLWATAPCLGLLAGYV